MILIVLALSCMGIDMIATLEAHGYLSSATVADLTALVDPGFWDAVCPVHSPLCGETVDRLTQLYAWALPGVAGVCLLWLGTLGRTK